MRNVYLCPVERCGAILWYQGEPDNGSGGPRCQVCGNYIPWDARKRWLRWVE